MEKNEISYLYFINKLEINIIENYYYLIITYILFLNINLIFLTLNR